MKELDGLNAAYASMRESGPMLLTKADKVGNTPAWRNRHKKNVKTGDPIYKMADHLKDEYESELWNTVSQNLTELHQLGGVQFKVVPLDEKQKDTPDQVKAVIAYDKARKGTEDAVYDTEHGKKKQAKKERDYAKWQRDKGAEDAQKSGHPWEHAKGSTREKEGKKSEKHAHIKDAYNHIYQTVESLDVDDNSLKGVTKKEVKNLQKAAVTGKGKYVAKADSLQDDKDWGYDKKGNSLNPVDIMKKKRKKDDLFGAPNTKKEELEATGIFTEEEILKILWNQFDEGYQRNPEKGEEEARKADRRSSKEKRMADPKKGINSPAFKEFMRSQGM